MNKKPGGEITAGSINLDGFIKSNVTTSWKNSTFSRIVSLITEAENSNVQSAGIVERYAAWFTPAIILTAAAVFLLSQNISSAITVLIVGCPCAFLLSGPIPVVASVARAAREGIMIKSGKALEAAASADALFIDKTGTLTEGNPVLLNITSLNGMTDDLILKMALTVERGSEHPLAKAVVNMASERGITPLEADDISAIPGIGVHGIVNGKRVFVGTDNNHINSGRTSSLVTIDDKPAGLLEFGDTVKDSAVYLVKALMDSGIRTVRILSGDRAHPVSETAAYAGINEYFSRLTPEEKYRHIQEYNSGGGLSIYAGDGINDAPAIKAAHVGIAMGNRGTGAVLETADIVLMNDRLDHIPFIIRLGKRMTAVIKANIILSLSVNIMAITAASMGLLTPIWGAVAHNAGSIAVVVLSSSIGFFRKGELGDG